MAYENVTPPVLPDFSPVSGYKYNGYEHPAMPNVDRSTYPYALLCDVFTIGYLFFSTVPLERAVASTFGGITTYKLISKQAGSIIAFTDVVTVDGEDVALDHWAEYEENTKTFEAEETVVGSLIGGTPKWADYDILKPDGSVYPAASDPVPIVAYPYYILVFNYAEGESDWYGVQLNYAAEPFVYDTAGGYVTKSGEIHGWRLYQDGAWDEETLNPGALRITPGLTGSVYQRIYTNHDILDSSGNVWLAADSVTPVEETPEKWPGLKSWLIGYVAGLAGKPLPMAQRRPVAYLYNGVRLPGLPEWDKDMYPYAAIEKEQSPTFLYMWSKPPIWNGTELVASADCNGLWYSIIDGVWGYDLTATHNAGDTVCGDAMWTNTDIKDSNGTVHLTASAPIPVYE